MVWSDAVSAWGRYWHQSIPRHGIFETTTSRTTPIRENEIRLTTTDLGAKCTHTNIHFIKHHPFSVSIIDDTVIKHQERLVYSPSTYIIPWLQLTGNSEPEEDSKKSSTNNKKSPASDPDPNNSQQPAKRKSVAQADEELREKLEQMSGEGGAAGIEYEDGKPNTMKRSVRNNMFRYIWSSGSHYDGYMVLALIDIICLLAQFYMSLYYLLHRQAFMYYKREKL